MAQEAKRTDFAFLYRSDQGVIDARTWLRAAWPVAAVFVVTTAVWIVLRPLGARGLDQRALFNPLALGVGVYAVLYTLCTLLVGICWVNLTAKRFRDLGRVPPLGLAGLTPLLALFDGALRWLQPRLEGTLPHWSIYVGDLAVAVALIWTIWTCLGGRSPGRSA